MFNKPNLPKILEIPYSFINSLSEFNILNITKTSLNLINKSFKGFETFDNNKEIFLYYFKRFGASDKDLMIKSFKLILDWSEVATNRYIKIVNLEQVTNELNEYLHENYQFEYNQLGNDLEYIINKYQIKIFFKKTLAEYISEISNIPVYEDKDDLEKIGMNDAMEIDVDKIYIDSYEITNNSNEDNW